MPFEFEPQTMRYDIHTLYELLDEAASGGLTQRDALIEAEKAAVEMLAAAEKDEREITVMARGGTDSYNLFILDPVSGEYSTVEDDEAVYGVIEAIRLGEGQYSESGRHLYVFFAAPDRYGDRVRYAFNMADEASDYPCRNRLSQVTEPSLEIEYVGLPEDLSRSERWQQFGDMTWEWFDENGGCLKGEDLLRKIEEEIIDGDFDIDEYTTAVNCLLNPGALDRLEIEAIPRGPAYQLKDKEDSGQELVLVDALGGAYSIIAVDFRIDEDEDKMLGYVFWHNTDTGYIEQINLNANKSIDLCMKEA